MRNRPPGSCSSSTMGEREREMEGERGRERERERQRETVRGGREKHIEKRDKLCF